MNWMNCLIWPTAICREKKRFEVGVLVAMVSKSQRTVSWKLLDDQKALIGLEKSDLVWKIPTFNGSMWTES